METLNTDNPPELVANIEVMQILEERVSAREAAEEESNKQRNKRNKWQNNKNNKLKQRDWVEEKVLEYLKSTPCGQADIDKLPKLVKRLRGNNKTPANAAGFGLTDAESLQVLNFMPRESVEIHLMIGELQNRMTDARQEEMLDVVEACLVKESENEVGQDDTKMDDAGDEEIVGEIEDLDLLEGSQIKVEEPAL
jgi:hypothetical protein